MPKSESSKLNIEENFMSDSRMSYKEESDVGNGSWVLIIKSPCVAPKAYSPKAYYIYWGVPLNTGENLGFDSYGRQAVRVNTGTDVTIFTDEYSLVSEERLQVYKDLGWELVRTNADTEHPLDMNLINEGRSLVEEEREVIWALMVDGLTEQQACEEYFLTKHVNTDNMNIYYRPNPSVLQDLINVFGER